MVYAKEGRERFHTFGGFACARCRFLGTTCSLTTDAMATMPKKGGRKTKGDLERENAALRARVKTLEAENVSLVERLIRYE